MARLPSTAQGDQVENVEVKAGDFELTGADAISKSATAELPSRPKGRRNPPGPSDLDKELDRVSLVQALHDTEAATARVIDLTERLVEARQQITELRGEVERTKIEYFDYRSEHEEMKRSMAYRIATAIWNVRNAFRL